MKKSILFFVSLLSAAVLAEELSLNYSYREVANRAQSGEYGWHDTTGSIMFAGAQMGFVGAGSFATTANVSILKFEGEAGNAQRVVLATDANGFLTLNINSGLFAVTSVKKLRRGFHRFSVLVRRGVEGGNTQIAQVVVHIDGVEIFNVGDGVTAFSSGPFRLATFGGTAGNLVSGAMWESAASCGNAESDADVIAMLDADAAAKYSPAAQTLPSDSYKLVWSDEFEGETVDWTKWSKVPPVTSGNAAEWRKYTSERDDLVSVENGVLTLRGIANDGADPSETRAFLCGQLWSKGKAAFTRGIFEIRAKFENQQGAWPALWMLPEKNSWPLTGEIDFVERLNSDDFVHQTVHHGPVVNGSSTSDTSHDNYIDPTGWNTYRVEWTSTEIIWYVNGVKTFTYAPVVKSENKWPFTTPFYLILSQQLEGNWVGQVDPATLPVNMYVDYVRVYQDQAEAAEETVTIKGGREDLAFTALQTQSSFYRGKSDFQPLIGLKAEELQFNTFWRLTVELPDDVDPSIITDVKLYKTTTPYFAFSQATEYWNGLTKTRDGRKVKLSFQDSGNYPTVNAGDYLWVCVRISENAPANAKIDAKFTEVVVNGYFAWVMNADPKGYGRIYPWAFHIVPYWRLNNWTMNALTADHFAAYTDLIAFYITIDANGHVGHGWNGEQFTDEKFKAAIDKMKVLRGDRDVKILVGVGFSQGNLPGVTADPVKRKRAARELADFVERFGLDGVDFDWEYPTTKAHWEGWCNLVTDLKPLLFALPGGGKQVSVAVTGWKTQVAATTLGAGNAIAGLYQQCDFVNMMSYDEDHTDGHSRLALMQNDFSRAATYGHLPVYKINGGQAFYTNHYPCDGSQNGYSWVVNNYPQHIDSTDRFTATDGKVYTYNSIATIKAKCADALNRGGGVMIWANETDVALTHEKSATRAMASVIRPTRTRPDEVAPNADWTRFTTTTSSSPTWASSEDGSWVDGVYTVRFSPLKFTVSGGADTVTMNLIAALPKGQSGALAGWKINDHTVQLVYDASSNRFNVTYDGTTSLASAVHYEPFDVTKAHTYTITVSSGSNGTGTYVYQDGNLVVNAAGVKWSNQRLNLNYTFGGAVDGSLVFYGMKIYAADLNYADAANNQDRILPESVKINGRALSTEEKRSAAKLFGPLIGEVDFVIAAFDPETGTIELNHNAPFVNGSVSVLGASALNGPWTRVATIYQPTEKIIQIDKARMVGYNFFKVVVEEGRQTLGPVEIAQLADLPSKDFPAVVVYHASGEQYRIPAIAAGGGIAIAAYDMRPYAGDLGTTSTSESYSPIDIAGNYSTDGGETWTSPQILVDVQNCYDFTTGEKNNSRGWASRLSDLGDVCMVYDEATEKFFMMGITGGGLSVRKASDPMDSWDTVLYTRGTGVNDQWVPWTGGPTAHPRSVRDELIACLAAKGVNTAFTGNQAILAGPGHGMQTKISNPGRLVIPMQYFGPDGTRVFAAYSDDHGVSWQVTKLVPSGQNSQENSIAELDDGSWYMIAKNGAGGWSTQGRHLYRTTDFENWTYLGLFTPSSKVQGSILKLGNRASDGKGVYAMAFCTSLGSDIGSTRNKLYLYFGVDNHEDAAEPILWDKENYIPLVEGSTGSKGYNSMIMVNEGTLGILYESNAHIYFRRIDIRNLLNCSGVRPH